MRPRAALEVDPLRPWRALFQTARIPLLNKHASNVFALARTVRRTKRTRNRTKAKRNNTRHEDTADPPSAVASPGWAADAVQRYYAARHPGTPRVPLMSTFQDPRPVMLTVGGGAGRFPYAFGMAVALRELVHELQPGRPVVYGGISSGALVAFMLALNLTYDEIMEHNGYLWAQYKRWHISEWSHTYLFMKRMLYRMMALRPNGEWKRLLNHRLFVGIARWNRSRFDKLVVSTYETEDDVVQAILASTHLFAIGRWPLRMFRLREDNNSGGGGGTHGLAWVADGGFFQPFVYESSSPFFTVPVLYWLAERTGDPRLRGSDFLPTYTRNKWNRLVHGGIRHVQDNATWYLGLLTEVLFDWNNGTVEELHRAPTTAHVQRLAVQTSQNTTAWVYASVAWLYNALFNGTTKALPSHRQHLQKKHTPLTVRVFRSLRSA